MSNNDNYKETHGESPEQQNVIQKLETLLKICKRAPVHDEESLKSYISEPLSGLLSNIKFVSFEDQPAFSLLPPEIKHKIFDHLCEEEAFICAAVCPDWRNILNRRVVMLDQVTINCISSDINQEALLKASIILKMDIPVKPRIFTI